MRDSIETYLVSRI